MTRRHDPLTPDERRRLSAELPDTRSRFLRNAAEALVGAIVGVAVVTGVLLLVGGW